MKREVKTLCPYCGVGCGLIATTDGSRVLRVRGDPRHPANPGQVCLKGATAADTVHSSTRLHYPMIAGPMIAGRMTRDTGNTPAVVSTTPAVDHEPRG